jgi:hypothetical protein
MIPARSLYTINLGLFEQNGGWVFVAVKMGDNFYGDTLFSGKRRTLQGAMEAGKKLAGEDADVIYSRLDNTINDWTY